MATDSTHMEVDKDTPIEQLLGAARTGPLIIEMGGAAYRINPVGTTSSPFTVEGAYASVRTVDGRGGTDISDEELEAIIDEAKDTLASRVFDDLDA